MAWEFLVFLAVAGATFYFSVRGAFGHKKRVAALKAAGFDARQLPNGKLSGAFRARTATVETAKEGRASVTYFALTLQGVGDFGLSVSKTGLLQKLGVKASMYDVTIGDSAFDSKFNVETSDVEAARRVLNPATREWIARPGGKFKSLDVWKGKLTLGVELRPTKPEAMVERLDELDMLAEHVEAAVRR